MVVGKMHSRKDARPQPHQAIFAKRENVLSKLISILAGLGITLSASAIGLGDIQVQGVLNQPFHATVPLTDLGSLNPQDVKVQLATIDKYNELNIDRPGYLSHFSFTVDDSQAGHPQVVITSDIPIDDPIVNVLLLVNASGTKFYREYTIFLDPNTPAYSASGITASSNNNAPAVKPYSRPASSGKITQNGWYGPTHANDTLWHIAINYQPKGASVEQTAVAIYQNNSNAFINNDINKLKAGVKLRIPSTKAIQAVSPNTAHEILSQPTSTSISSAPSSRVSQTNTTEIPPLTTTGTSTSMNATTNTATQNTTTMPSNPMVLTTPTPQEATIPAPAEQTTASNTMQANATSSANALNQEEQKMKDELDYLVKSLQTEQATNQLLSTQMQDIQHRNEELQHDLSEKDALIMNLQALVNQKQQTQAPAGTNLPSVSQGGALMSTKSTGPSWALWISLVILLAAAGAAYWQRQIVLAFLLAQKKNLLEKLGKSKDEEEFEEVEQEFNEMEQRTSFEMSTKKMDSEQQKSNKVAESPTDNLVKELLQTVDDYIATERYNKAELELNLFLSHYPGEANATIRLLEIFVLTKKKQEFERALYGFSISNPNPSQAIQDKIAALQKTDWQATTVIDTESSPLSKQDDAIQEMMADDLSQKPIDEAAPQEEFHSAVSSTKSFDHAFATPIQETQQPIETTSEEHATPEMAATKEREHSEMTTVKEQESLSEAEPMITPEVTPQQKDEHNIDFISGLGSGFSPVIRDTEEHTEQTSTVHEIHDANASASTPLPEDSDAMKTAVPKTANK